MRHGRDLTICLFGYRRGVFASRRGDGLRNPGHEQRDPDGIRDVPVHDASRLPLQRGKGVPAAGAAPAQPARGPVVARDQSADRPGQQTGVRRGIRAGRRQEDRVGQARGRDVRGRHQQSAVAHALR